MKYFLFLLLVVFSACDKSRIYEKNMDIEKGEWKENNILTYGIDITDASVDHKIFYNVRYSANYPYYNLYVTYYLLDSAGKEISQRLQGMDLMNPKTGKPFGDGLGDQFDYRIVSEPKFKFPYAGKYTLKVKQYMREDPIQGILAFGFRIEKLQ